MSLCSLESEAADVVVETAPEPFPSYSYVGWEPVDLCLQGTGSVLVCGPFSRLFDSRLDTNTLMSAARRRLLRTHGRALSQAVSHPDVGCQSGPVSSLLNVWAVDLLGFGFSFANWNVWEVLVTWPTLFFVTAFTNWQVILIYAKCQGLLALHPQ